MFPLTLGGDDAGARLSQILRDLRRHRRMRPADVARAMDLPLRSYEHFEAGGGRLNLARIEAFARATNSDPFAILAALALDAPDLAVRCADNKLVTIFLMALEDFDAVGGPNLPRLDPQTLIGAFERLFAELGEEAGRRDDFLAEWFAGRRRRGG